MHYWCSCHASVRNCSLARCTLRGAESGEDIHGLLQSMPTPTLTKMTLNGCGEVPVHALLLLRCQ